MAAPAYRPSALAQLYAKIDYIAADSPQNATKVLERITKAVARIGSFPGIGRPREDLGPGLRSWAEKPVVLVYKVLDDDSVEIVAVAADGQVIEALMDDYDV